MTDISIPVMTTEQLQEVIPNRPPYLWLDEVLELTDTCIRSRKFLDPKLPVFSGHYPEFPLFPGALQCETALQAASVLVASLNAGTADRIPVAARMSDVKFRRMVHPGETLETTVELVDRIGAAFYCRARVQSGGETTTTLRFVVTEADRPQTTPVSSTESA